LAERGWQVGATDISSVALGRAVKHARTIDPTASAPIEWRHVDLLVSPPEHDSFDLASVRAGGALLVVGHHSSDMASGVHRPPQPDRFYTADDIAGLLDASWTIVVDEVRPRSVTTLEGDEAIIHDAVLLAVRE
jgi:hypothetical protein